MHFLIKLCSDYLTHGTCSHNNKADPQSTCGWRDCWAMRNGRVSRVEGGGGNFNKSPKWTPMSSSRPSGLPQFRGNARLFHPDLFCTQCIIEDTPQTFICEQRVKKKFNVYERLRLDWNHIWPPAQDANLISDSTNFVFNHSLHTILHTGS